jgi:RNA polymerase sporulation-specific sigma factor
MNPESLYAPVYEGDGHPLLMIDKYKSNDSEEIKIVDKIALCQILKSLEPRERKVIILRYFKEKTQTQIAKILGISQVQVSRIEKKVIDNIRKNLKQYNTY